MVRRRRSAVSAPACCLACGARAAKLASNYSSAIICSPSRETSCFLHNCVTSTKTQARNARLPLHFFLSLRIPISAWNLYTCVYCLPPRPESTCDCTPPSTDVNQFNMHECQLIGIRSYVFSSLIANSCGQKTKFILLVTVIVKYLVFKCNFKNLKLNMNSDWRS